MLTTTFDAWMKRVDAILVALCGVTSNDLPDCPYADWFADNLAPTVAARRAIRLAGYA